MYLFYKNFFIFLLLSIFLPLYLAYTQAKFERIRFVYTNAPENLILQAREIGANERLQFFEALESAVGDDEKMSLYTEHLSHCSLLGSHSNLEVELDGHKFEMSSYTEKIFSAIGLDRLSSKLFTMPMDEVSELVQNTCLNNELQFQCAYGFLDDIDKIHMYINDLKKNDGNVKIMFEKECLRQKPESMAYICIGKNIQDWGSNCGKLINAYNLTRTTVNEKIQFEYVEAAGIIDANIAIALDGKTDPTAVAQESASIVKNMLNSVSQLEAFKCRMYAPMERCVLKRIHKACGPDSVFALRTILRTGYLLKERGVELNEQFNDNEIGASKACEKLSR